APDSPTDAPVAEVVDSGPDCLADEVIEMLTGLPQDAGRSAPSAGSVPQGFEPVRVVRCTISLTEILQEPAPPTLVPRLEDADPGASIPEVPDARGADLLQRLTVEEVTLTGDLAPPARRAVARVGSPQQWGLRGHARAPAGHLPRRCRRASRAAAV